MQLVRKERIDGDILAEFLANPEKLSVHLEEFLDHDIGMLRLSARTSNVLKVLEVRHIRDLVILKKRDLLGVRKLGPVSLKEIEQCLKQWDLSLGMTDMR